MDSPSRGIVLPIYYLLKNALLLISFTLITVRTISSGKKGTYICINWLKSKDVIIPAFAYLLLHFMQDNQLSIPKVYSNLYLDLWFQFIIFQIKWASPLRGISQSLFHGLSLKLVSTCTSREDHGSQKYSSLQPISWPLTTINEKNFGGISRMYYMYDHKTIYASTSSLI